MSPERVVVVGASGFGRECLDVLDAMAAAGLLVEVTGVVDDGPSELNLERLAARGVAFLGTVEEWLATHEQPWRYVLGVGSPSARRRLVARLEDAEAQPFTAIHPSATLGARVEVGEGVIVCAGATISTNVRLGRHVHVNPNATIGHDADLQDFVSVNPSVVVSGEVRVGEAAMLGAAATVLQCLIVGEGTIVGAGSVVTKDLPPHVVAYGAPCRVARERQAGI
jgi:sugar O-acyltransferase (sialic acid O-acetyltransferase NeuD family)